MRQTIFTIGFLALFGLSCNQGNPTVRLPVVAGGFYPASPTELKGMIDGYLSNVPEQKLEGRIYALLCSHAGYQFSGQVAAHSFKELKGRHYDTVIIIGPSHHIRLDGASVGDWDFYQTPLGKVKIDKKMAGKIRDYSPKLRFLPSAHQREHSAEVEVPFLQRVLKDFQLIPIVMGNPTQESCQILSLAILKAIGNRKVLLVASSDMSHYPTYEDACKVDRQTLSAIESFDQAKVFQSDRDILSKGIPNLGCTLCGLGPVVTVMMTAKGMGAEKVDVLHYANSGDVEVGGRKNRDRVVGYGAVAFYTPKIKTQGGESMNLTDEEKAELLGIARTTLEHILRKEETPEFEPKSDRLREKGGVFVTLTNQGRLRGCIGHFPADTPLYKIVSQMAVAAATQDYRFYYNPVTLQELDQLRIEISVLSPMKRITDVNQIRMGVEGIYIKQGNRAGTFLPQVATETGWSREEFLNHCCQDKAGLPPECWKKGAEIYTYTATVFHE